MRVRSVHHRVYSYAFKCNPYIYKDLVHDAYIWNYHKDGTNLFDKNIYTIFLFVKNVWFNYIRNSRFQYKGTLYQKQWYDITDMNFESGIPPDKELISKEFCEEFEKQVDNYHSNFNNSTIDPNILRKVFTLTSGGYSQVEIAEQMGMSPQRINYYRKKLKEIAMEVKSIV